MRSRGLALTILLSVLCTGGAIGCFWKIRVIRAESEWVLARASAQAQEYAATFDGSLADRQLATFEVRRQMLERAHLWERLAKLLILASVLLAFVAYALHLLRRLHGARPEGDAVPLPHEAPAPAPAPPHVPEIGVR